MKISGVLDITTSEYPEPVILLVKHLIYFPYLILRTALLKLTIVVFCWYAELVGEMISFVGNDTAFINLEIFIQKG